MSFYPELDHLNLKELIARFQDSPLGGEEYASVYYSEVALLIRQKGEAGIAFLRGEMDRADTERWRLRVPRPITEPMFYPLAEDEEVRGRCMISLFFDNG